MHLDSAGLAGGAADGERLRIGAVGLGVLDNRAVVVRAVLRPSGRIDHVDLRAVRRADLVEAVRVLPALGVGTRGRLPGRRDRGAVRIHVLDARAAVLIGRRRAFVDRALDGVDGVTHTAERRHRRQDTRGQNECQAGPAPTAGTATPDLSADGALEIPAQARPFGAQGRFDLAELIVVREIHAALPPPPRGVPYVDQYGRGAANP